MLITDLNMNRSILRITSPEHETLSYRYPIMPIFSFISLSPSLSKLKQYAFLFVLYSENCVRVISLYCKINKATY